MASITAKNLSLQLLIAVIASISIPAIFAATVVEDLNNLRPPPDFNLTITNNCRRNPNLRYCNSSNLLQIFKSTIVASHLCNISNNPNCVDSFPKIDLRSKPKIAPLYLSFSFFWKFCPLTIVFIDLSNTSLQGSFPNDVFYCSQIRSLDLRLNNLSGEVPVEKLSSLQNLTSLNLSYNSFSESKISDWHFFERFNSSSFIRSGVIPDHRKLRIKVVLFFIAFPVVVIAVVVFFCWFCFWRENRGGGGFEFRASELEEATGGFSKRNLAGKCGGRGSVYKGVLGDGSVVSIEVYFEKTTGVARRRFVEECGVLVRLEHQNIVPVRGWCESRRFVAVVSEWVDGKDVMMWIRTCVPPWKQRVQVILGIAAAVRYLREEWPQVGYKYNLKSRNVIVSGNGEPVLTRFEFEDYHSGQNKIYDFGVLILEIVTNRWMGEAFAKSESGFVEWMKVQYSENMEDLIDGRMNTTVEIVAAAAQLVEFGLICVDKRRPSWEKFCHFLSKIAHTYRGKGHKQHVLHHHQRQH